MNYNNLSRYGLDDSTLKAASSYDGLFLARVINQQKNLYVIISELNTFQAKVTGKMMYNSLSPVDYPTVGDWVMVDLTEEIAVIHNVLPRKSAFERKAAGSTSMGQLIASNIDVVFICMSLNENYNLRRLERYLSVAWSSKAYPCVLLTKADLTDQIEFYINEVEQVSFGADLIVCSSEIKDGFDNLEKYLKPGKTYAFIGSSGVGKSTIVNYLMDDNVMDTFSIGYKDRGRHITSSKELFVSSSGSIVIDTPGMRELGLDSGDFSMSFSDIETLSRECKFKDCRHESEPGCAVKNAISNGTIARERLANYFKMKKEFAHEQRRIQKANINAKKRECDFKSRNGTTKFVVLFLIKKYGFQLFHMYIHKKYDIEISI